VRSLAPARAVFCSLLAAVFVVAAVVCALEPNAGDCWFGLDWQARSSTDLAGILRLVRWNYANYNPRFGETFLYLTVVWRGLHVILTPAFIVMTLLAMVTLALGRLPRPGRLRDSGILLVAVALMCSVQSIGQMAFYRPFSTNYVYGFCLQAWLLVPLRLAPDRARWWAAPGMLLLGLAAGMCNEHTGPTLIVAYALLGALQLRRSPSSWPWVLAGFLGLVGGYLALYFAPAQLERHRGRGRESIFARMAEHGLGGTARLFAGLVWEAIAPSAVLLVLALRARAAVPWRTVSAFAAAALAVGATLLAAPFLATRMYLASALLLAIAALAALVPACASPRAFRALVGGAAAVAAVHAFGFLLVYAHLHADYAARTRVLERAPAGQVAFVTPTRHFFKSHWALGDDLANSSWHGWIADHYHLRTVALDTTDVPLVQKSGLTSDWDVDARPMHGLPATVAPPPLARPLDAAFFERARAYAEAAMPDILHDAGPSHSSFCLRLFVAPVVTGGKPFCLARWHAGQLAPLARLDHAALVVPAATWPFPESFLTSLAGVRTLLTPTRRGADLVFPASAPPGPGPKLFIGCDAESCVLGSVF